LKEAFGYLNFFDYYEMLDDLGEGIFGSVKLGVEKKTKERVAIKIIKKNKTKQSDIELVRTEIDVMKLCHHPNVVHLLDHFENAEYIFIVMEYIRGGRLTDYMKEKKFNFTEKRAAEIIYQIAQGVKYLHKYGIIHRDLKPDNIMLTEASDKGQIKIMDFGLSKILGKKEKTVDGFGTLTFVSPEVLIRKPYNKEIDIWSIGVILYLLLSGDLPFDDEEDDEQKIAKSIVFNEVEFPQKKFGNRSKEVINLIKKCLTKEPKNRIKIDEIIKSDWIQEHIGAKEKD
jgi:serine/threonine protein kinase